MSEMFEKASRLKVRVSSAKGMLTVEDLWDLPLTSTTGKTNLDDIARDLYKATKESEEISFVRKEAKSSSEDVLAFEIVKHIIDVKLAENEVAAKNRANAEKKQQLLGLIAQKENEQLAGTSLEELRKMVDSL